MRKNPLTIKTIKYLLAGSLIFYIFSGVSSVLNYAFYPIIARFVNVSQYGEIQFLTSMYNQLAVGFVVLNILAIIISVKISDKANQKSALAALNHIGTYLVGIITVIGSCILYQSHGSLQLSNPLAIIAMAFSILISVPYTTSIGQLQGNGRFVASGVINIILSFAKLVFATLFVLLGWGVVGAILGIGAGVLFAYILTAILNKNFGFEYTMTTRASIMHLQFVKNQAIASLVVMTILTLLSTADSIISRIVLTPHDAGVYAAIATISKIILTVTSPLMWLALPAATANNSKLVARYVKLTALITIITTTVILINPLSLAKILFGISPTQFSQIIPFVFVSMACYGLAYVLVAIHLCFGNLRTILYIIAAAVALFIIVDLIFTPIIGLLYASIIAQLVAGVCIAAGGIVTTLTRHRRLVNITDTVR